MLSPADIMIIGAAALIFFGPDQLPKVAKRAGQVVREVQNTSQSFIREMERAADDVELRERAAAAAARPPAPEPTTHEQESAPFVAAPANEAHDLAAHDLTLQHGADEMLLPFGNPLTDHTVTAADPKPAAPRHETYEI